MAIFIIYASFAKIIEARYYKRGRRGEVPKISISDALMQPFVFMNAFAYSELPIEALPDNDIGEEVVH